VSDQNASQEAQIEDVSSKLSEGLKTCRSVVENYRSMIGGRQAANDFERSAAANDDISITGEEPDESDSIPL